MDNNEVESEPEDRFYDYVQNILGENEDNEDFDEKEDEFYLKAYTGQLQFDPTTTEVAVSTPDAKGNLTTDDKITPGSRYYLNPEEQITLSMSDDEEEEEGQLQIFSDNGNDEDKKSAQRRYYEPANENIRCYNCQGLGHMASQCLEEKTSRPCIICGELGHTKNECSRDICWNCNLPGHQRMACKNARNSLPYTVCYKCGRVGHSKNNCTVDLRRKRFYREPSEVYCYNCGEDGHTGLECRRQRIEFDVQIRSNSSSGSRTFAAKRSERPTGPSYKRFDEYKSKEFVADDSDSDEVVEYYDPDDPTTSEDEEERKGSRPKKILKKGW